MIATDSTVQLPEKGFSEFIEMARMLIPASYEKSLEIVVTKGREVACSDQCCLIIQNKRGEFVLKAGVPENDYRIGCRIDSDYTSILKEMLEKGDGIISVKDTNFPSELIYAAGMEPAYRMNPILYMPLYYKGEPLGLMIFGYKGSDYSRRFNIDFLQRLKSMGILAATAIGAAYERKRREKEIARKERLTILGENSASVAHLIRNALTSIGGFAKRLNSKLLLEDMTNGNLEKAKEYSEIIQKEIQKLEKITNDVLSYTRLASQKLKFENCNINQYLNNLINGYTRGSSGLQINFFPDNHDVTIQIDREAIGMCIDHLIRNAIEANARTVIIKTKIKAKMKKLSITITNDGEQICSAIVNRIFDPFVTTKPDGTGLGLANTQAIIAAHGGDISVISECHKTEFRILLPIMEVS